jgi:hypothetical protein
VSSPGGAGVKYRRDEAEAKKGGERGQFICHEHSHSGGLLVIAEVSLERGLLGKLRFVGGGTSATFLKIDAAEGTMLGNRLCTETMRAACRNSALNNSRDHVNLRALCTRPK